jgi:hypothetical protein
VLRALGGGVRGELGKCAMRWRSTPPAQVYRRKKSPTTGVPKAVVFGVCETGRPMRFGGLCSVREVGASDAGQLTTLTASLRFSTRSPPGLALPRKMLER